MLKKDLKTIVWDDLASLSTYIKDKKLSYCRQMKRSCYLHFHLIEREFLR